MIPVAVATRQVASHSRAIARFAIAATLLTVVVGGLVALVYRAPAERAAILISAGVALVVQLAVFAGLRFVPREHVIAAWGLGTLARFATLVVYAFVVVKVLALPAAPALVSLVACLFASTLLEPLFLKS